METSSRYYNHGSSVGRSGYEPSDTETDWQDSPWRELTSNRREEANGSGSSPEVISPTRRRQRYVHKSPVLTRNRNVSPFSKSERRRHVSCSLNDKGEIFSRKGGGFVGINQSRRSVSASRVRAKEESHGGGHIENVIRRSPVVGVVGGGELNELVASGKILSTRGGPMSDKNGAGAGGPNFESTDSISPGDIFFSHDVVPKIGVGGVGTEGHLLYPRPKILQPESCTVNGHDGDLKNNNISTSSRLSSRVTMTTTSAANVSKRSSTNSGKLSSGSFISRISDASGKTTESSKRFVANRRKNLSDAWFSCVRKGYCRKMESSSPERRAFNESLYIEKAYVVEKLRPFWADKHRPSSLNGFICNKHQAQILKQLVSL